VPTVEELLRIYKGAVPRGENGDRAMRARARSGILERLSREQLLRPSLSGDEVNDLVDYIGWQFWDMLGMRATEGESGLIPRQEYEAVALIQQVVRYGALLEAVTDAVGAEGVIAIGESARHEIGSKKNVIHEYLMGSAPLIGRGIFMKASGAKRDHLRAEMAICVLFMARVLFGHRGDGFLFSSQRGYRSAILSEEWVQKFRQAAEPLEGGERQRAFQQLNASTELLAFLTHLDCRLGLADSGPYDLGNGEVLLVRDHFLGEEVFDWCDLCEGLPYALTLGFVLDTEAAGLRVSINDISTTFTSPPNYHPYVKRAAVFVRPRWDSPVADIRQLAIVDSEAVTRAAKAAVLKLYRRFSRMSRRQLITAGLYVYYIDMILPFLRAAGIYDRLCKEQDLWEIAKEASDAYYIVCRDQWAQRELPFMFMSGEAFPPFSDS
jgi:hypothetical protein